MAYAASMAMHDLLAPLAGPWTGTSNLWLDPAKPARVCDSTAHGTPISRDKLLRLGYTWSFDGQPQEGSLVLSCDEAGDCRAAWTDSWHMNDVLMLCRGKTRGELDLFGEYGVGAGEPPWGWRTRLEVADGELKLLMWNVTPSGEEAKAVEGLYRRGES